tara:strand:+ start:982 stop:1440 length:459 start_codon:yes stop_codon:yes gene_type:complete
MKMYIAVLDQVPDFMVPTLVAHTVLAAHHHFLQTKVDIDNFGEYEFPDYVDWLENNFSKVVLRVNQKEFNKIAALEYTYLGHENTTLEGRKCCAIPLVCANEDRPNVLRFAKMWAPDNTELVKELAAWKQVPDDLDCTSDVIYKDGKIVYVY